MAHPEDKPDPELTEEMRKRIQEKVNEELNDHEEKFVDRSIAHMDRIVLLAPAIARTTKALYDAFRDKGFDENKAFALVVELQKSRGIVGY